jgi:dTDP-4-amino-4,6-dideoxygalactose transaminase
MLGQPSSFKNCELAAKTVLSLPLYPQLSINEIEYICAKISDFLEKIKS